MCITVIATAIYAYRVLRFVFHQKCVPSGPLNGFLRPSPMLSPYGMFSFFDRLYKCALIVNTVVEESGAIPRPCEGGMEEEQHAAGAVLQRPPSPAAQRQEALGLAATDIQVRRRQLRQPSSDYPCLPGS